jgi:hypothetical protein
LKSTVAKMAREKESCKRKFVRVEKKLDISEPTIQTIGN